MKAIDRYNIETIGIPSLVLMERAALAVVQEVEIRCPSGGQITVFCGYGNNGADGLAAARMLALHGYSVQVILVGDPERATADSLHRKSPHLQTTAYAACRKKNPFSQTKTVLSSELFFPYTGGSHQKL